MKSKFASQSVTLTQVAKAAGVSPSTVSRILNGTAHVTPEKFAAVQNAVARLGYRPNVVAQGLARGQTKTIGVFTPSIASPFYSVMGLGVEDLLISNGYIPLFASTRNQQHENELLELFTGRRIDGLILLGTTQNRESLTALSEKLPVMVFRRPDLVQPNIHNLHLDNIKGALLATRHLLELGHTRIMHLAGTQTDAQNVLDGQDRLDGYLQALKEADIPVDRNLIVHGDWMEPSGLYATLQVIEKYKDVTAIFAANDQMALGARLALHNKGIRVPEDISVIGFDDISQALFSSPPLTTIGQPKYEMGQALARMMMAHLDGWQFDPPNFEPQLMVRGSSAPPGLNRVDARRMRRSSSPESA